MRGGLAVVVKSGGRNGPRGGRWKDLDIHAKHRSREVEALVVLDCIYTTGEQCRSRLTIASGCRVEAASLKVGRARSLPVVSH